MADAIFSVQQVNITDYIIIRCRKATDPGAEISRQVFGIAPPTTINVDFPDLDLNTYLFDIYESSDGTALNTLFGTFLINVGSLGGTIIEYRFYVVGRGNTGDPTDGDTELDDAYFSGKTVVSVHERGLGILRDDEWSRTSGGVALTGGNTFNTDGNTYAVELTYGAAATGNSSSGGLFTTESTITADTTLDSTYYNNLINCNGTGSQLTVTFDSIGDVPDGTNFMFVDQEGGTQNQTKFVPAGSDTIKWNGQTMTEIWIGKGEFIWLKKKGTFWKVVNASDGLMKVGTLVELQNPQANTLYDDFTLYNAADYPRFWWYILNVLAPNGAYINDNVDSGTFILTADANKSGQIVYSITKQKFRMGLKLGMMHKGLDSFSSFGSGGSHDRPESYPGGFQAGEVGEINANVTIPKESTSQGQTGVGRLTSGSEAIEPSDLSIALKFNIGGKNLVDNIGVLLARWI